MAKLPISVFIIAKDEADRIPYTINSVRDWVDEVIVVDSGSTDDTVKVAEQLGARVMFNAWEGYGPQKVFAESLCKNKWVLNLDADEEISTELAQEIQALFAPEPEEKAYRLNILALYPYQKKLPRFAAGTTQVRLYHRDFAGFKDAYVHDSVVLKTGVREVKLHAPVIHRSFRSLFHMEDKINRYTTMQAEDMFARGRNPSALYIIAVPFVSFFKCYVLKKYVCYGLDGFIHSCQYAHSRLLRAAKAREEFQRRKV